MERKDVAAGTFVGWEQWGWVSDAKQYFESYIMILVVFSVGRNWMDILLEPGSSLGPSGTFTSAPGFCIISSLELPRFWNKNSKRVGNISSSENVPEKKQTFGITKNEILLQLCYPFSCLCSFILSYFSKQRGDVGTRCWASVPRQLKCRVDSSF